MVSVTITEKGGKPMVREFDQPEITIGRVQGNDIVLPKSNISKRHARIVKSGGNYVVIDAKSTNGTYVNGKKIAAPHDLRAGDKVFVGDFTLELRPGNEESQPSHRSGRKQVKTKELTGESEEVLPDSAWSGAENAEADWAGDWANAPDEAEPVAETGQGPVTGAHTREASRARGKRRQAAARQDDSNSQVLRLVHERLSRSLEHKRAELQAVSDDELRARTAAAVREIVQNMSQSGELPGGVEPGVLVDTALAEAVGMGPLEELLNDQSVTEILVNGPLQIFVEREGKLEPTTLQFSSEAAVMGIIERIVAPLGRRIDASAPMVDARLRDGSRVNAVVPPLALRGPILTIRKFTRDPLQIDDLVAGGTLNADMAEFLEVCVQARKNIVISGGTGSGKTTLLNVVSSFIDASERILTIEDAAELKLVVPLEARPSNADGKGSVGIRELVRNALRMRPDRIIVGECRGGEALDMLQAMNTGHDGSLTTVHANSPRDALSRMETMVLMSGMDLPVRAIREQVANAVDIIVQQARFSDGGRRITHISEIVGMEGEVISMHDLFVFDQIGFTSDGRVQGRFKATGFVPKFYEGLRAMGLEPNLAIFRNT
jgi:pilus assembly protein CpaF